MKVFHHRHAGAFFKMAAKTLKRHARRAGQIPQPVCVGEFIKKAVDDLVHGITAAISAGIVFGGKKLRLKGEDPALRILSRVVEAFQQADPAENSLLFLRLLKNGNDFFGSLFRKGQSGRRTVDKFGEKMTFRPAPVMIQNQRRDLDYPAVELAPAYKSMIRQGSDEEGGGVFERIDDIADMGFSRSVTADGKLVLGMVMPVIVELPVPGHLKTERVARGWIYHFCI